MTTWWWVSILVVMAAVVGVLIWMVMMLRKLTTSNAKKSVDELNKAYTDMAEEDAAHLFNKEFREELRNRGRLRFEKIIDENAMFLKQDLDMTISQLNEYIKKEISKKLEEEFAAYSKAMKEAQELGLESLQKTAAEVDRQRTAFTERLEKDVMEREATMLKLYEANMAKIVEHYVTQSLGEQFDLKTQLPYIIAQLEANKQNIIEDMRL